MLEENIRMNVYNVHEVEDFNARDEFGIKEYTKNGKKGEVKEQEYKVENICYKIKLK